MKNDDIASKLKKTKRLYAILFYKALHYPAANRIEILPNASPSVL
jgi:hypothetical protein